MNELLKKIKNKEAKIAVIGLGYVGLPLAIEKAKAGFTVIGIERKKERVDKVNQGENYIPDVLDLDLENVVKNGFLKATQEFNVINDVDVIAICVPTPLDKNKNPVTKYIENVVDNSLPYVKRGQLFILESTTYPGTTEEVILPRIEKKGFEVGQDFFLAYSPERIDPGNKEYKTGNTPKVVGGVTPQCTKIAKSLYEQVISGEVFPVSSPKVAEMTKLLENIFRVVNVSLVNELALLCDKMKIDIWEVIEAAKTKPFGYMPFYPGPGLGGHCIPIDPFYLSWKAQEHDFTTRFIELAGEINDGMPDYVVSHISELLNTKSKCINGSKILLLGMAYKKDVDDLRESPAVKIANRLIDRGAELTYHDPYINNVSLDKKELKNQELSGQLISSQDLVVITTAHSGVDYETIVENAKLIFDTRNALKDFDESHIHKLGS